MDKSLSKIIMNLWKKSAEQKRLTFFENLLFLILCFFEKFYCLGFLITQIFRKKNGNKVAPNLKVISVGNLSAGGTGKSVFVGVLIQILGAEHCVIISRGYGGRHRGKESLLVSDGHNTFCTPDVCGDEPYMLAHSLHVPVVVGSNRYKSCLLQREFFGISRKFSILDDGYQNHKLKKDLDILLIDARSPFGNGHCLPAGNLREKDYSRADLIVLTHADEVSSEKILQIKTKFLSKFDLEKIFCGKHKHDGLFLFDDKKVEASYFKNRKFLVVAAIGSFDGFVQSVRNIGIHVDQTLQFPDHHNYSQSDIEQVLHIIKKHDICGVITTQKDWSKLYFLIKNYNKFPVFISRVEFEFIKKSEYNSFNNILREKSM
jgi:tetraacyldisaccharide 4'-kinase